MLTATNPNVNNGVIIPPEALKNCDFDKGEQLEPVPLTDLERQNLSREKLRLAIKGSRAIGTEKDHIFYIDELFLASINLEANAKGKFLDTFDNVVTALSSIEVHYDVFTDKLIFKNRFTGKYEPWSDKNYVDVAIALTRAGFVEPTTQKIKDAIRSTAQNNPIDGAILWSETLPKWDGIKRVEKLLSRYFGCEESQYSTACSQYLATAMAGRLLGGVKADMVVVLTGPQGLFKSTAVKTLAPFKDTFAEADLTQQDDNLSRLIKGKIIVELDEMRGFNKRESASIKSWITREDDEWTPKYCEFSTKFKRRCVFIATTNDDEFLNDATGNRRYLPLKVRNACDPDGLRENLEQIWAESIHLFNDNGVMWGAAQLMAVDHHKDHVVSDEVMDGLVEEFVNTAQFGNGRLFKLCEFMTFALDSKLIDTRQDKRAQVSLRRLGYFPLKGTRDGKRDRYWTKGQVKDVMQF